MPHRRPSPTKRQALSSFLEADFSDSVVLKEAEPSSDRGDIDDLIESPPIEVADLRKWIKELCQRIPISPSVAARNAGIYPSTINRFLADDASNKGLNSKTIAALKNAFRQAADACPPISGQQQLGQDRVETGLNQRLRMARERAGYSSAADAAARLSVPYGTYSGHENGGRNVKRADVARYAAAFGVSCEWLEFGSGSAPKINPDLRRGGSALERVRGDRDAAAERVASLRAALAEAEREEEALNLALAHLEAVPAT